MTQTKGLVNDQLAAWDRDHLLHPTTHTAQHARGDVPGRIITGGDGVYVTDRDGNRLLDAFAALYCVNAGYGRSEIADAIAKQAGIDEVRAELLPEDKVDAVEKLVEKYEHVAMIGDGVNDAPALARASLGLAMGAAGSDAALETADIALMSDDLSKLPWLIHHSRRTLNIIRQNIGFSLAIKALFVSLTFAGYASLWAALGADMGASLLVIANGLRLLGPERQID